MDSSIHSRMARSLLMVSPAVSTSSATPAARAAMTSPVSAGTVLEVVRRQPPLDAEKPSGQRSQQHRRPMRQQRRGEKNSDQYQADPAKAAGSQRQPFPKRHANQAGADDRGTQSDLEEPPGQARRHRHPANRVGRLLIGGPQRRNQRGETRCRRRPPPPRSRCPPSSATTRIQRTKMSLKTFLNGPIELGPNRSRAARRCRPRQTEQCRFHGEQARH